MSAAVVRHREKTIVALGREIAGLQSDLAAADLTIADLTAHLADLHRQYVEAVGRPPIPYPGSEADQEPAGARHAER